jgi:hypothetical protein
MKYYIVALFDNDSYEIIHPIQRKYSKKFRANRNSPTPFIALDIIDSQNIEKITPIIEKVLKPYKQFKVQLCDNVSISDSLRTLNLEVENRGYIKKIYTALTDSFELHGMNIKFAPKEELGLSLATVNNLNKDTKSTSNYVACDESKKEENSTVLKVNRLEIWKLTPNKKEMCVKSFPLRSF